MARSARDGMSGSAAAWPGASASAPVDGARDGVLLTGATGFLGAQLLIRYLERTDRQVYALVRGASDRDAAARLEQTLLDLFGPGHPHARRVVAVRGDIARPGLGLGRRRRDALAERVGEIVHCAASVSFAMGLREARAINVQGTARMLELARRAQTRGGLRRFTYVSTAYVAGEHAGCFSEDDLDVGQRFRNAYERSKFEAETMLERWRGRLPLTVVRPSIVVGERDTGWTSSFNVLYWPLRAFSRGSYVAVPGRGEAPVDVVSVDYVAEAIFALAQAPEALGARLHVTGGRHTSSVEELVALASAFFERPAPRLIEPSLYQRVLHPLLLRASRDPRRRRVLQRSTAFFPYFAARVRYDDRRTRAILHGSGIEPSPLPDYFHRLVDFALAADWGRSPIARSGEAALSRRQRTAPPPRDRPPLALAR